MSWKDALERGLMAAADACVSLLPQPRPAARRLDACKIVSHRGEHAKPQVKENTLAAFELARAAGIWGIELDVRWTRDGEPIVFHDADLARVHGVGRMVSEFGMEELRRQFPSIPMLAEVVARYGSDLHLMVEIKGMPKHCGARLQRALEPLAPARDFHLLSLQPAELPALADYPPSTFIAVAGWSPHDLSRWALKHRWGGLCSHYLLLGRDLIRRHHAAGQSVGIGYAESRSSLFRELNRGVDWIFSNHAAKLQRMLGRERRQEADR